MIPDSLYCFFPQDEPLFSNLIFEKIIGTPKNDYSSSSLCLFAPSYIGEVYICIDSIKREQLCTMYKKIAKREFAANDNYYFVIGSEYELSKKYDSIFLKNAYVKIQDYSDLIPYFQELFDLNEINYDTITLCTLPSSSLLLGVADPVSLEKPQLRRHNQKRAGKIEEADGGKPGPERQVLAHPADDQRRKRA